MAAVQNIKRVIKWNNEKINRNVAKWEQRRSEAHDSAVFSEIISQRLGLIAGGCPLNWVWKAVSNYCNINQALACYHKVNVSEGGPEAAGGVIQMWCTGPAGPQGVVLVLSMNPNPPHPTPHPPTPPLHPWRKIKRNHVGLHWALRIWKVLSVEWGTSTINSSYFLLCEELTLVHLSSGDLNFWGCDLLTSGFVRGERSLPNTVWGITENLKKSMSNRCGLGRTGKSEVMKIDWTVIASPNQPTSQMRKTVTTDWWGI